jgi:F-type H+-transporting ATPase subunit a
VDFHPEDEFTLHEWVPIHIGSLDLSINKAVAYLMLGTVMTILLGLGLMRWRVRVTPTGRQTIGESIYEVAQTQIAEQGLPTKAIGRWFPYCATLLLFIWVINMVGFVPLPLSDEHFHIFGIRLPTLAIYAATAQLSVTLALSLMTFVFTHIEGVRFNGPIKYVRSLIPDVPKPMLPFIAVIEFISIFMRLISLSVRLFANMLAGHMLILVMIGLMFVLGHIWLAPISVAVATLFYLFEIVIVVSIQAFIFAALSAIYIGSAIEPDH